MTPCFCCSKRFSPNSEHHVICMECGAEQSPDWADEKMMAAARGLHAMAYGDLTDEALTFLATSAAAHRSVVLASPLLADKDWVKMMLKLWHNAPSSDALISLAKKLTQYPPRT